MGEISSTYFSILIFFFI